MDNSNQNPDRQENAEELAKKSRLAEQKITEAVDEFYRLPNENTYRSAIPTFLHGYVYHSRCLVPIEVNLKGGSYRIKPEYSNESFGAIYILYTDVNKASQRDSFISMTYRDIFRQALSHPFVIGLNINPPPGQTPLFIPRVNIELVAKTGEEYIKMFSPETRKIMNMSLDGANPESRSFVMIGTDFH